MSIFTRNQFFLTTCFIVIPFFAILADADAATDEAAATQTADMVYDADSYARLRVFVKFSDNTGLVDKTVCPKKKFLSFDLKKLLKGNKAHSIAVNVSLPDSADPITLIPLTISVNQGGFFSGGDKCTTAYQEIDYLSPLYHMDANQTSSYGITAKLTSSTTAPNFLSSAFSTFAQGAAIVAPVTAPAAQPAIKTFNKLLDGQTLVDEGSLGVTLIPGPIGTKSKEWVETGSPNDNLPSLRITARFEKVISIFPTKTETWLPSDILDKPFRVAQNGVDPAGTIKSYFISNGTDFNSFNNATTLPDVQNQCSDLQTAIVRSGFTKRDRSLILWAMAQSHPHLGQSAEIDHLPCLNDAFSRFASLSDAASLPKKRALKPSEELGPPTLDQIKLAVLSSPSLATFFKNDSWNFRRSSAVTQFANDLTYKSEGIGILKSEDTKIANADQWYINDWDEKTRLAVRFGCYVFRSSAEKEKKSELWAIGKFNNYDNAGVIQQPVERFVRMTFTHIKNGDSPKIDSVIVTDKFPEADFSVMKETHGKGCDDGEWETELLKPKIANE